MTSGVIRASVRSRFRWRLISWPAANGLKWVNPSIATVSPPRTSSRTASAIDATFDVVTGPVPATAGCDRSSARGLDPGHGVGRLGGVQDRLVGALAGDLGHRLAE